jgi:hypothetical protein
MIGGISSASPTRVCFESRVFDLIKDPRKPQLGFGFGQTGLPSREIRRILIHCIAPDFAALGACFEG